MDSKSHGANKPTKGIRGVTIEKSDLPQMHSIAVAIHRKNKKFDRALEICKTNKLWIEAIETIRDSNNCTKRSSRASTHGSRAATATTLAVCSSACCKCQLAHGSIVNRS